MDIPPDPITAQPLPKQVYWRVQHVYPPYEVVEKGTLAYDFALSSTYHAVYSAGPLNPSGVRKYERDASSLQSVTLQGIGNWDSEDSHWYGADDPVYALWEDVDIGLGAGQHEVFVRSSEPF